MKRVLITGGTGFIGYHLAQRLLKEDCEIDLLDNFSRGVNDTFLQELSVDQRVNIINVDLLENDFAYKLPNEYFYIFHLAAVVGVQHVLRAPYEVLVKNMILLKNTLDFAKNQKNMARFIFTSTSEVYSGTLKDFGLEFPTPESTPLTIGNPREERNTYMLSKIYGEAMCFQSGLPVTIVRPHNFYGPRMGLSHAIPELLKKAYVSKNGKLDVYSFDHKRTFCYIEDAVEMMVLLSKNVQTVGEIYNIGNQNDEITMGDLAKIIIEVVGKELEINPLPATPGSPVRRCPDMSKTISKSGYQIKYSLKAGIKEMYEWYRGNIFQNDKVSAI